jgi:hypothetical protein
VAGCFVKSNGATRELLLPNTARARRLKNALWQMIQMTTRGGTSGSFSLRPFFVMLAGRDSLVELRARQRSQVVKWKKDEDTEASGHGYKS